MNKSGGKEIKSTTNPAPPCPTPPHPTLFPSYLFSTGTKQIVSVNVQDLFLFRGVQVMGFVL